MSVLVPVLATSKQSISWLDECLASTHQSGVGQVIVVNDGSDRCWDDDLYNLAAKHGATYYKIARSGKSAARNYAVKRATYNLIYPLDADDYLVDGAMLKLLHLWHGRPVYR